MLSDMKSNQLAPALILVLFLCPALVGCAGLAERWNRARADDLITDAGEKFVANDLKGNVQLLKDAARIDPTNPRVWWKLCEGYQLIEEPDLAIAACTQNVELHPTDSISYNSLGLAYMAKKDCPNAVSAFEKATKDSHSALLYGNLVWSLECTQQYEKAIIAAQECVRFSADNSALQTQAFQSLGAIYVKLGQMDKAKETFATLHKIDSKQNIKTCELKTDGKGDLSVSCSYWP
jgi:tetratricopeptide (TPR) repeat protein